MKTLIYTTENVLQAFKNNIKNIKDFGDCSRRSKTLTWGTTNGSKDTSVLVETENMEDEHITMSLIVVINSYTNARYTLYDNNFFEYDGGARGFLEHDGVGFLQEIIDVKKTIKESRVFSSAWGCCGIKKYCKNQIKFWSKDNSGFTDASSGFMSIFS